ncbi:MAG: hypothetical protein ACI8PT_004254, partial [Gammaproteobacteria bacterium]
THFPLLGASSRRGTITAAGKLGCTGLVVIIEISLTP